MQRTPVESSVLASVGYDPTRAILEIEFHGSGVYHYLGVPAEIYQGLIRASSKGLYFDQFIKKAGYSYIKLC